MLLQVEDVSSGYGQIRVLWDVSIEVERGGIVGIIGANGAGKTTLLRTISGLLPVEKGSITFEDKNITNLPPHTLAALGISLVPEGRRIFGPLSVYENLLFGCYSKRNQLGKKERERLFDFVFELFPILWERRDQKGETLSGGEQQMLAIARGLMSNPKLLLIDEPSLGLAPTIIGTLSKALKSINEQEVSLLLVEQNSKMALSLAHTIYVLETGRIVIQGTSQELTKDERIKKVYIGA